MKKYFIASVSFLSFFAIAAIMTLSEYKSYKDLQHNQHKSRLQPYVYYQHEESVKVGDTLYVGKMIKSNYPGITPDTIVAY